MALQKDFYGTLTIAGEDFGAWDAFTGGGRDSDETKYTPHDGVERTYLGNPKTANITVSREYVPTRDGLIARRERELEHKAFVFAVLDRDSDGNFQQNRAPYQGRVKAIKLPDGDSDQSGIAKIEIELSTGVAP